MKFSARIFLSLFLCVFLFCSCGKYITETGVASYYSDSFNGKQTANGERFNNKDLTAAHKTLPFGTKVKVLNPKNGKSVKVRINDRGPFVKGRVLDLSFAAAEALHMIDRGVMKVTASIE